MEDKIPLWLVGLPFWECRRFQTSDTYDSFVVLAPTEELARECARVMEPAYEGLWLDSHRTFCERIGEGTMAAAVSAKFAQGDPERVTVLAGLPDRCVIVLGSFNSG